MENCNGYIASQIACMSLMHGQQKMTDHRFGTAISQAVCISELILIQRETKLFYRGSTDSHEDAPFFQLSNNCLINFSECHFRIDTSSVKWFMIWERVLSCSVNKSKTTLHGFN